MPTQQRVGRDDRRDLAQRLTTQLARPHGESPPVVIGQPQASFAQLAAQDAIFFKEIAEDFTLLVIQPSGEDGEQQPESRGVDHGQSLYHASPFHALRWSIQPWDITPFFGTVSMNDESSIPLCSARLSCEMLCARPTSSTAVSGQMRARNSSFPIRRPPLWTNKTSVSKTFGVNGTGLSPRDDDDRKH